MVGGRRVTPQAIALGHYEQRRRRFRSDARIPDEHKIGFRTALEVSELQRRVSTLRSIADCPRRRLTRIAKVPINEAHLWCHFVVAPTVGCLTCLQYWSSTGTSQQPVSEVMWLPVL